MGYLNASATLFALSGFLWIAIGALAPYMHDTEEGRRTLIGSPRSDGALFGRPVPELLDSDPALARLRTLLIVALGGMLVAAGVLESSIALFALRERQAWALGALVVAGVAVLPFWVLVFRPYVRAHVPLSLIDLPPFMWIPALLLVPAAVLGWIGLRA